MRREADDTRYKNYLTEALRILTENTTHYLIPGVGNVNYGGYLKTPWIEAQKKSREKKTEEPADGDQIAIDLMRRAGLTFGEKTNGSNSV